jgi:hypothetical protein
VTTGFDSPTPTGDEAAAERLIRRSATDALIRNLRERIRAATPPASAKVRSALQAASERVQRLMHDPDVSEAEQLEALEDHLNALHAYWSAGVSRPSLPAEG